MKNKNKNAQAFLSSSLRGSPGKPVPIPSAMADSDSQWRWRAGAWSSWTGGNGWEGRRIDSDSMNERTELLEARISSLEKEVAALRQAGQAAVASPVLPEPKAACAPLPAQIPQPSVACAPVPPHGHECAWHEHRPDAGDPVSVSGNQEKDVDAWLAHLRHTLYSGDSRPLDSLESKIKANWERIEVTTCRSKANRFFHVRCKRCDQCSYGEFGTWAERTENGVDSAEGARFDLAKFFKHRRVPSGKPEV